MQAKLGLRNVVYTRSMPRLIVPILACALGVACALALVSCGGSDKGLLPGTTASEIVKNIDLAQQKLDEQDCGAVRDYAQTISDEVTNLPASVDKDLRQSLRQGAGRLQSLADDGCQLATTEAPTTDSTTPTEVTTDEPTTDATTNATTPTDETTPQTPTGVSTQSTPTTPTTPPVTTPTTPTTPPVTTPTTPAPPGGGVGPGAPAGDG